MPVLDSVSGPAVKMPASKTVAELPEIVLFLMVTFEPAFGTWMPPPLPNVE